LTDVVDVLVVGGGAAGCELAWGLARRGIPTTLLTTSLDTLYALPADAWPGRPPPGTLWAEVAAEVEDGEGRQRAGPLRRAAKRELERMPSLRVVQSNTVGLLRTEGGDVVGVRTWEGPTVRAALTVLAVGSFLGARLTLGPVVEHAGRLSEMAYDDLRDDLRDAGLRLRHHRVALAGDRSAPPYTVDHDVVHREELESPFEDGRQVAAAGRSRRWRGLWFVGACTGDVGLEAAAAAGRDLAAHLAGARAPADSAG
jgi:tRNA U34 5-carboxymethylaminomethyl modifying enzyme MnmG/GidA